MNRFITLIAVVLILIAPAIAQIQRGPRRLRVVPADQVIGPSGSIQFQAILSSISSVGQSGGQEIITTAVVWSSSNKGIVSINASTGLAAATPTAGTTTITAHSGPFWVSVP